MNNPSVVNGFTYSGETSDDDDDPNEAYYYAGKYSALQNTFLPSIYQHTTSS